MSDSLYVSGYSASFSSLDDSRLTWPTLDPWPVRLGPLLKCISKAVYIIDTMYVYELLEVLISDTLIVWKHYWIFSVHWRFALQWPCSLFLFFSVRLLSVPCGHPFFSSPPQRPMTSDFGGFLSQILSITF